MYCRKLLDLAGLYRNGRLGAAGDTDASALRSWTFPIGNREKGGKVLRVPTCSPGYSGQKAEELLAD